MKIRKTKKGFTIVELVIVIAVIGVLTAILVPTFISLTAKANKASDQSLVANLNTALKMQEAEDGAKNPTMHDAVLDLAEQGFDLGKLVTKSKEALLWNSETNQFELEKDQAGAQFWKIYDAAPTGSKVSVYAKGNDFGSTISLTGVGFDAGYNTSIATVNYAGGETANDNIIIRTNGGDLNVNAPNDSIKHYGNLNNLNVTAIKASSYHENGIIAVKATLVSGRIEVESEGYIKEVDTTSATAGSSLTVNGYVSTVTAAAGEGAVVATGSGYVANNNGTPMGNASALDTTINDVNDLLKFKAKVNDGYSFAGLTVKLAADLDITSVPWEPIGKKSNPFVGTFDGKNHTITGLSNNGYELNSSDDIQPSTYSGNYGSSYGFFGVIGGETGNATTIKDLTLDKVNIESRYAKNLGGLFGSDAKAFGANNGGGSITIQNIAVKGTIKSTNTSGVTIGGIGAKAYNLGRVDVIDCTNYANLIANDAASGDAKVAGVIGFVSNEGEVNVLVAVFDNCKNYGNMEAKSASKDVYASGIASKSWGDVYFKNCSTQGKTKIEAPAGELYYSVISRLQNYDVYKDGTVDFENVTYTKYKDWGPTFVYSFNNSISTDSNFDAFETTLVDDKYDCETRVLHSSDLLDGDLFYWYNCLPAMPWNPKSH